MVSTETCNCYASIKIFMEILLDVLLNDKGLLILCTC
jgi:hypothetical protein